MRGSEGDDSGEDTGRVMKRMCLSTQSVLSASPASIATFSSASPSVCSALRAAVLVVARLQPQLKLHRGTGVPARAWLPRAPRAGPVIFENWSAQLRVTRHNSRTL